MKHGRRNCLASRPQSCYALDDAIAAAARAIPSYLGAEAWKNASTGLISNVYYWDTLGSLQTLMSHPIHPQAKRDQAEWLVGDQIVVTQVIEARGDGQIAHPLTDRNIRVGRAQPQ